VLSLPDGTQDAAKGAVVVPGSLQLACLLARWLVQTDDVVEDCPAFDVLRIGRLLPLLWQF
jgi:hypothetical protein